MKNKELWVQHHFKKDSKGRIQGSHMHKIIGHAYEKVIKEHTKGLLADVGSGEAPYYFLYKDLVTDNICIDWGKEDGEISFLDKIADLNEGIPWESNAFDTVLCTDVLEHIHQPALLFSEMTRIMKDGAKLILTVPFMYWIHDAPYDYHRYTKYMLEEFCKGNNLKVISIEAYGGWPEVMYDLMYKGYASYNLPLRRIFFPIWVRLGRFLYNRRSVKKLSQQSRDTFPLGYILVAQK